MNLFSHSQLISISETSYNQPKKQFIALLSESYKILLFKSKEWEYEKEWRLLTEINPKAGIKPKAVYITDKISKTNRSVIEKIANDKNIPVKLMELNLFDLKYVLIEKSLTQITNPN